jgi:hypothetical protein
MPLAMGSKVHFAVAFLTKKVPSANRVKIASLGRNTEISD